MYSLLSFSLGFAQFQEFKLFQQVKDYQGFKAFQEQSEFQQFLSHSSIDIPLGSTTSCNASPSSCSSSSFSPCSVFSNSADNRSLFGDNDFGRSAFSSSTFVDQSEGDVLDDSSFFDDSGGVSPVSFPPRPSVSLPKPGGYFLNLIIRY